MPLSPTEEIKERLDIAHVVGDYVKLEKAGANLRALCPFHSERSPSFFVSPSRQTWHCFGGCGEGGDVFTFIMKIEGLEFRDALRLLAERAGVQLPTFGPAAEQTESQRKRLADLVELACQFFEKQMTASEEARAYLVSRKISSDGVEKWRIGYAPNGRRGLLDFLVNRGFTEQEAMSAGLAARSEGGLVDRFRGRIIFPVCDLHSNVLGFGGRLLHEAEGMAKYLNCPNTLLYDKSRVLYGLDKAKVAVRKGDAVVLVEGYMDVILVAESGFENVVASSGTALTSSQLRILKRYTDNLVLAFDMDTAGDAATRRGIESALEQGFHVKVVVMPQGKDPADVASKSSEAWRESVKSASSVLSFYLASALGRFDKNTPEGKGKIAEEVLSSVKKIPNRIEQAYWVREIAKVLEVPEKVVHEELWSVKEERQERHTASQAPVRASRRELLEERTLGAIVVFPHRLFEVTDEVMGCLSFSSRELVEGMRRSSSLDPSDLSQVLSPGQVSHLSRLGLQFELAMDGGEESEQEFAACILELSRMHSKERLDTIAKEIKKAEDEKDDSRLSELVSEFQSLSRKLHS